MFNILYRCIVVHAPSHVTKMVWIFTAFSASGHLISVDRKFREARREAKLPEKLVLYCGRHDYGTRVLQGTGNLAVVMRTMGHGSPSTAMKYQHPELEQVRAVLNGTKPSGM